MSEVTRYNKLSMDNIQFEKPENKGTVYFGPMMYDLNPLLLQSSRLIVKEIKEVDNQKFIVFETSPSDFSFYDTLVKLDDHILDATYQNSEEWFNKELPMDILENMYTRVTTPFKKDKVPSIQFKLAYKEETIQTKIYNQTNEIIDIESLVPGATVITMIQVKGLKFLKQIYYCDICLSQIKLIKDTLPIIPATCLIEDDTPTINQDEGNYAYEILDTDLIQNSDKISELIKNISDLNNNISERNEEINQNKLEISERSEEINQNKLEISKMEELLKTLQ